MVRRFVLGIVAVLLFASPVTGQVVAIRAGQLVDTEAGTVTADQIILIESGIVTAVGSDISIPAGAEIVDLSSSTVLPGLFDAHTHLCLNVRPTRDSGRYYLTSLQDSDAARAIDGMINARAMLEAGFTTVRDVGNEGAYACTEVRRAFDAGRAAGPTIINAGRIIAPFGGQFHLQPDRRDLAEPEYFFADTRDEMVKAIRENVHFGAMVIKIVVDDQDYIYSPDDIRFMIQEAARAGRRLAAHAWTAEGAHNAAEAGVASIEHLWSIEDADLELAKRNGVIAVFTPFPDDEWNVMRSLTPEGMARVHAQQIDRIASALRIGIPMVFGTDAITEIPGHTRGTLAMSRIDMFAEAGMTPEQLLQSMTVTAARLLGVSEVRGMIAPGMAADIIATPRNPLDDIQELKRVSFVMKDGVIVRQDPF
jgi:imidazolonepropionase-like amidohydrolase